MPVEIRELVIRTQVRADSQQAESSVPALDKAQIVQEAVDQVMKKLKNKTER